MARTPSSFLMIAPIPRGWGSLITRQVLWCNPRAELVGQAPAYGFVERPIVGAQVRFADGGHEHRRTSRGLVAVCYKGNRAGTVYSV
jgi:hypothetical protein